MGLRTIYPPARLAVESADVQRQLATYDDQGAHVEALIAAAVDRAESYLGRALVTRTLALTLDAFPGGAAAGSRRRDFEGSWRIELPLPPLQAVIAIRYLDQAGQSQTMPEGEYRVSQGREPAAIEPAFGRWWPTALPTIDAVEVEYRAGYGDDGETVPAAIRQAIVLMVGEWLEHREGLAYGRVGAIPHSARYLLDGERLGRLFAGGT